MMRRGRVKDGGQTGKAEALVIGVRTDQHGRAAFAEIGVSRDILTQVVHLAKLAKASGLDGVVSSPQEITAIREACGPDFHIVTPGIRPRLRQGSGEAGSVSVSEDDQARTLTPKEAIEAGASYLVIGRPITGAPNPREAAEKILTSL